MLAGSFLFDHSESSADPVTCCFCQPIRSTNCPARTKCVRSRTADLSYPPVEDGLLRIEYGGGGDRMRMTCGLMARDAGPLPLLENLPDLLVINVESHES